MRRAGLRLVVWIWAFLLAGSRCVSAQALPPPILGDPGDPFLLDVPYALPPLNALQLTGEKQWRNQYLLTRGFLSDLPPSFRTRAPRLYFRSHGLDVSVGTQLLNNATPFHNLVSFSGGRLSQETGTIGWSLWGGRIENLDQELSGGIALDRSLLGGSMGWRPNAYSSYSASLMGYAAADQGPVDRTIGSVSAFTSDRRFYSLSGALARDFGAMRLPGERPSAREAWRLNAEYSRNRLSAAVAAMSWGRMFGPPQGIAEQRGQHQANALLQYRLSPTLTLVESYVNNGQETPGIPTGPMSVNSNLQHRLVWSPVQGVNVQGGLQQTSLSAGTPGTSSRTSGLFLQAGGTAGSLVLTGDARSEALAFGSRVGQMHLRVGVPLNGADSVFVDQTYFSTSSPGALSSNVLQGAAGYSHSFADERGVASVQYSRQFPVSVGPLTSLTHNTTVMLAYRPLGNLWVGGTLNMSDGSQPGSTSRYSEARVRWIIDEHSDLAIYQRFNSGGTSIYDQGHPVVLKDTLQLSYRLSFGGAVERSLRLDRRGQLTVQVSALAPGTRGPLVPLVGVPIRVGKESARTDRQGRAVISRVDPGTYTVTLPADSLSANYELQGPRTRKIEVGPGEFARTQFRTTAWASVYAVVWSDPEGSGKLPETAYTPLQGIRVKFEGGEEKTTNPSGSADFARLRPGRYRISIDPTSVPRGLAFTTPPAQDVEVKPGQEAVVSFGLQGFGRLRGRAAEVPVQATTPTMPMANVNVLVDGRSAGRTDGDGNFELRIPAGHHALTLDPDVLTASRYVVNGPVPVDVEPDQVVSRSLVVASYGNITVALVKRGSAGSAPVAASGVVVNFTGEPGFLYTDDRGQTAFDRLIMGRYTVSIDAASLPAGLVLAGPASETVPLSSGERRRVEFVVRPR